MKYLMPEVHNIDWYNYLPLHYLILLYLLQGILVMK